MRTSVSQSSNRSSNPSPLKLACDIDETLALTRDSWIRDMLELFGNPEGLSIQGIIEQYGYVQHVPYWQTNEALEWAEQQRTSGTAQLRIDPMPGAREALHQIARQGSLEIYCTTRPDEVKLETKVWLRRHGFPDAELVMRPNDIAHPVSDEWKGSLLGELYPQISGIIDDKIAVATALPSDYKGIVFLLGHTVAPRDDIRIVPCPTWKDVSLSVEREISRLIAP